MAASISVHLGLAVARMHGVLVTRPGSRVFHVYAGPLTPSGRFVPRVARTACGARTRRLSVLERVGSVLDLGGRRVCGRCSARLSAVARRAEQPVSRDDFLRVYGGLSGVTLGDLVVALAMCTTVDENRRVAYVASVVHGFMEPTGTRRPVEAGRRQARYDFEVELLRQRRVLTAAERTPEEVEAAARRREDETARSAQLYAARRKAAAMDRALDRRQRGQYLMPHERALLSSA